MHMHSSTDVYGRTGVSKSSDYCITEASDGSEKEKIDQLSICDLCDN